MKNFKLLLILPFILVKTGFAQLNLKDNIENYDDVCFCNVGLVHPYKILELDNNKEIVLALKKGKTLSELKKMGIQFKVSQIKLLTLSGLVTRKDSIYTTAIPILANSETTQLREATKKYASEITALIKDEYKQLNQILSTKGFQKNSYSVFFSYVLDGMVWDILEKKGAVKETVITAEKPFWDGVFWLFDPKRDYSCGTNSLYSGDMCINVNWNEDQEYTVPSYDVLSNMLNDYMKNGKITDTEVIKTFEKNNLFDKNGFLKIPVIKTDSTDQIFKTSEKIANIISSYLINDIDYSKVLTNYPKLIKNEGIVIIYHEIMWDILDNMEKLGILEKPVAFGNPKSSKPEDLRDLIFIVEYKTN